MPRLFFDYSTLDSHNLIINKYKEVGDRSEEIGEYKFDNEIF